MKTKIYAAAVLGLGLLMCGNSAKAQIQDEQNVTVTMDMQPVLQLFMTTSNQVNFTFNTIESYMGGEIQYGATILKVSSSVNWDLYAVGTSTGQTYWDNQIIYGAMGANASTNIPLGVLELHQYPSDNTDAGYTGGCTAVDYSTPFAPVGALVSGQNNIYVNTAGSPYVAPTSTDKYIAGGAGTTVTATLPAKNQSGEENIGGSYLTAASIQTATSGASNYYYVIDYRLLPGLPVTFPADYEDNCTTADPNFIGTGGNINLTYYQPGVYTMDVKYVLLQDQ